MQGKDERARRSKALNRIEADGWKSSTFNQRAISRYGCECFDRMTFEEYRAYMQFVLRVTNARGPRYEPYRNSILLTGSFSVVATFII